jgi:hypothetical protein
LTTVLNLEAYYDLCHDNGITSDVRAADAFGVDRSVATRLRRGQQRPGIPFISGLVDLFDWDVCSQLFQIVPDRAPHRRAVWERLNRPAA